MIKLRTTPEGIEYEVEGADIKESWQQMAFLQALPTICPVDNSRVRFGHNTNSDGEEFYYLVSTPKDNRTPEYKFDFGMTRADKKLFPGKMDEATGKAIERWYYWDGKKKVVMWEEGRLLTNPQTETTPQHSNGHVELSEQQKVEIELERIGQAIYGNGWPTTKKRNVDSITNNRPGSLTVEHMNRLIAGMRKVAEERQVRV